MNLYACCVLYAVLLLHLNVNDAYTFLWCGEDFCLLLPRISDERWEILSTKRCDIDKKSRTRGREPGIDL